MEQEAVEPVLNSVLFDVWEAAVLPLLSLVDIFQLCGVTRDVRELLHNENTFRRLCLVSDASFPKLDFKLGFNNILPDGVRRAVPVGDSLSFFSLTSCFQSFF
eukprot:scpid103893/ scgid24317/ 